MFVFTHISYIIILLALFPVVPLKEPGVRFDT
jgi:hypothetical protein